MTARQDEFVEIYRRYRVEPPGLYSAARASQQRRRRTRLCSFVLVLLSVAVIGDFLADRHSGTLGWTWAVFAASVAALALVTSIVASESPVRQITAMRANMASSLLAAPAPGPAASEKEVAAWVAEVEAVLRCALPGGSEAEAVQPLEPPALPE